ncbi:hypothetical protein Nocox_03535 [Nonomuraea coxensis DSM 45129]|uniref:DUF4352 domain-containing protein n=1 Tax=Nonomuraea coxensis DSM 45129 TaxID=1122611 RepID=A0ABX8TSX7_9ACTN|nr:hypothetical protein [Nonomuraea coxensis]QYC38336.1 hypothetical protein Nocox_03535 [Nonomuraea coxensis DSM 45129]
MTATEPRATALAAPGGPPAGRRPGLGPRLLAAAAGVLLIAGAMGLQTLKLGQTEVSGPIVYTGSKGEDVDARRFTLRLDSIAAAKALQGSSKTLATDHVFLVLAVSAKSSLKPYHLAMPMLVTADGKRFEASDRVDRAVTLSNTFVQPDIWVRGRFYFEVPASALPGASALFSLPQQGVVVEPYQPQVEIDLGLDDEGARKLVASAQDVYPTVKK